MAPFRPSAGITTEIPPNTSKVSDPLSVAGWRTPSASIDSPFDLMLELSRFLQGSAPPCPRPHSVTLSSRILCSLSARPTALQIDRGHRFASRSSVFVSISQHCIECRLRTTRGRARTYRRWPGPDPKQPMATMPPLPCHPERSREAAESRDLPSQRRRRW